VLFGDDLDAVDQRIDSWQSIWRAYAIESPALERFRGDVP
jgi:hypothetical protein